MKHFQSILFVIISGFVLLSSANAQPHLGGAQKQGNGDRERYEKSLIINLEKQVELNQVINKQSSVYELRCRGIKAGGTLRFANAGSRTDSSGAEILTIELSFSPSLKAAGSNSAGLEPGECSWVDRPINRNSEPWRVLFETPANAQLKQKLHGSEVDTSPTAAERYPDANTIQTYLGSPNRYWSFFVYNTGQGYFLAKSHQHWKASLIDKAINPNDLIQKIPF